MQHYTMFIGFMLTRTRGDQTFFAESSHTCDGFEPELPESPKVVVRHESKKFIRDRNGNKLLFMDFDAALWQLKDYLEAPFQVPVERSPLSRLCAYMSLISKASLPNFKFGVVFAKGGLQAMRQELPEMINLQLTQTRINEILETTDPSPELLVKVGHMEARHQAHDALNAWASKNQS